MPHRASLGFVFAVVLIDMLGFGIVIPVLPGLIMHLAHVPVSAAAGYAGWLGAGYATMQFICAPIIGNLSDRFGRRPVMLAAILALGMDYLLQSWAPAFGWLIVGRLLAGVTGASFSAAYAYIADITPPEKRAASFGLVGMAFGLGFVVGPALGGVLGSIAPRLPFLVAGLLALANFVFGLFFLKESLAPENRRPLALRSANALSSLRALRGQNGTVLWFVAALAVWQLAHIVYPAVWSYMAIAAYGFSTRQVGFALAVVGLSSALMQGFGLRRIVPWLGERRTVVLGVVAQALARCCMSSPETPAWSIWRLSSAPPKAWCSLRFPASTAGPSMRAARANCRARCNRSIRSRRSSAPRSMPRHWHIAAARARGSTCRWRRCCCLPPSVSSHWCCS